MCLITRVREIIAAPLSVDVRSLIGFRVPQRRGVLLLSYIYALLYSILTPSIYNTLHIHHPMAWGTINPISVNSYSNTIGNCIDKRQSMIS